LYRTVRHLSATQAFHRLAGTGRRRFARAFPDVARKRLERLAADLPLADPSNSRLGAVAAHVLELQRAVHGNRPVEILSGRFTLLNRTIDFGTCANVVWRRDVGERNNPLWRMNLAYMGYLVPLLNEGRREALDAALVLLRTLDAQNPFSEAAVFRDVWHPYTASHRLINLLSGLALYRRAGGRIEADEQSDLVAHARLCGAFVHRNLEHDLQYNHLLKNYVALAVYAAAAGQVPAAHEFLERAVPRIVASQVLADGGHAERSPMYHLLVLIDVRMLRDCGLFVGSWGPFLAERLAGMERALAIMSHPDGEIALFNDSWLGEGPAAASVSGVRVPDGRAELAETGYVRLAAGGDVVLFDCGPCGPDENPSHAHADFLSIELTVGAERFVVDPGVATYAAGRERDQSRAAESHNGPHLSGSEPVEFWGAFRVGHRGRAYGAEPAILDGLAPLWCAGWQDGYVRLLQAKVARYVGLWPGHGALIADLWRGGAGHAAASHFLLAEGWELAELDPPCFRHSGLRVRMSALRGRLGVPGPMPYWPRFGEVRVGRRVALLPAAEGSRRFGAVWVEWGNRGPPVSEAGLAHLFDNLASVIN
jgi:uncharacterized heparinase superfamily protein